MKQKASIVAFTWPAAFVVVVFALVSTNFIGQRRLDVRFTGVDAVFLGTSLMRRALPDFGEAKPLAQIGASKVLRVGINSGAEGQILDMASAAIASGVQNVFIEINPLVSRFARVPGCGFVNTIRDYRRRIKTFALAFLLGRDILGTGVTPIDSDQAREVDVEKAAKNYPLKFEGPCHMKSWVQLVTTSGESRIFLIAMPRDDVARQLIGIPDMDVFERRSRAFAAQLGLPLFVPDASGSWGPDYFIDQAHMSRLGSERFLEELAVWWLAQK